MKSIYVDHRVLNALPVKAIVQAALLFALAHSRF